MLRRLLSALVMVVLVAPAIAMCAGTTSAQASPRHDCCPNDEMAADISAPSTASMTESCCRMSDAAGQRVPAPASQSATAPQQSVVLPVWASAVSGATPASYVVIAPLSSQHVRRHLLLSVLIV